MLYWFIVATACLVVEMLSPFFVLVFFAVGALAASLVAFLDMALTVQCIVFCLVSVLSLVLFRKRLQERFSGRAVKSSSDSVSHDLAGCAGTLSAAIEASREGQVQVNGSYWRAVSRGGVPLAKGTHVIIEGADPNDALLLIVRSSESRG